MIRTTLFLTVLFVFANHLAANSQVVTTHSDQDDNPVGSELSLREAIREAGDELSTITFDPSVGAQRFFITGESLLISDPEPSNEVNGALIIDASALEEPIVISAIGLPADTDAFNVTNRSLILKNVIIEDAPRYGILAAYGDASDITLEDVIIRYCGNSGINFASGDLVMSRCEVHGNGLKKKTNDSAGYGLRFYFGRTVEIRESCFYHNFGGGVAISGLPDNRFEKGFLSNCTIAENGLSKSKSDAGGVHTEGSLPIIMADCTIVDNLGGGVAGGSNLALYSCIVARNREENSGELLNLIDHASSRIDSMGYNLCDTTPAALAHSGDVLGVDPKLSRLGYFGGVVPTCFPEPGSPALGAGNPGHANAFFEGLYDGRGFARNASRSGAPASNIRDIGAVEAATHVAYYVTSAGTDGPGTLDTMINAPGPANRRIIFSPAMSGATISVGSLELGSGAHIDFDASSLAVPLTLQTTNSQRGFWLREGASASFQNIRFRSSGSSSSEPFFAVARGSRLGANRCEYSGNARRFISLDITAGLASRVLLNECNFEDNVMSAGAIISASQQAPSIQIWNSTFDGNESTGASVSAAMIAYSGTDRSVLEVRNCTFDGTVGAAVYSNNSRLWVNYSTFSQSHGPGALVIQNGSYNRVSNSLFYENTSSLDVLGKADLNVVVNAGNFRWDGNWSTIAGTSFASQNDFVLAPLGEYGGFWRTRPLLEESILIGSNEDAARRVFDAHYDHVTLAVLPTPGAVATFADYESTDGAIDLTLVNVASGQAEVEVTAPPAILLQFYGGEDLSSLVPIDSAFSTNSMAPEAHTVTLPAVLPEKYFLQIRSVL
ncbi:right-handed parallel beta-helix repeat-containing protein [Roseibacillus persicicus]|uniref:Right handed beta helix domain-containing protein n=1 Tax=Roseibacillus persicicus TaxID=454148 RepID=A0A918WKT6_9BACT|nr:right-handed parallel beta-helix repeat-containing protein [Roseibacillus persicicus]GHC54697.1 hypothetical protein GCM10007100_21470 [Roseibacillus persicicus]